MLYIKFIAYMITKRAILVTEKIFMLCLTNDSVKAAVGTHQQRLKDG